MHTSEYKHIRRVKEREFFFYFFFILSVYISSTARDFRHSSSTARIFGHSRTPSRLISRLFESGSSPRLVGQEKSPASILSALAAMLFLATPILLMYLRNHRIHQNPPQHSPRRIQRTIPQSASHRLCLRDRANPPFHRWLKEQLLHYHVPHPLFDLR